MTKREITGFVIDLATVVIGIALTFGISELIQQRSYRKEAERILSMVKEELTENLGEIEEQKEWLEDEQAGTTALRPYNNDPENIPSGTLDKETDLSFATEAEAMRHRFTQLVDNQAVRNYIVSTAQEDNPYGLEAMSDEMIAATRAVVTTIDKEVRR